MKRSFFVFAIAVMAMVCLSSCKDEKKCWSIKSTRAGITETKYVWCSEDDAVTEMKRMEKEEGRTNINKTEEKSYKTSSDCLANNPDL